MGAWRALLCCGAMLVPGGCVHTSSGEPAVRTKGGDSATVRIPILIANGQLVEAEQLLLQAIAAGLLSREAATRWQEAIRQRREQQSPSTAPERTSTADLWVDPEDPSGERRNCSRELPNHPVCQELPDNYTFHSAQQALDAMKQRLGVKSLILHKPAATNTGPCPFLGRHFNVRSNGERAGSIVCCPCCVDADPRPIEWTRCRIVW